MPQRFACSSRGPSRYTAFIVRGLLMLSVEIERRVERARARRVKQLEHEVARIGVPVEDPVDPEVLRADVGAEVLPLRVVRDRPAASSGSDRRGRTRTTCRRDTAGPGRSSCSSADRCSSASASHAFAACSSKSGFGNSRRPTMPVRSRNRSPSFDRSCRARRSRRRDTSARSRTDRAGSRRERLSSQSPYRFGSGPVGFLEARLVDQPEIFPAVVAAELLQLRMRRNRLQEIERAERWSRRARPRSDRCRAVQTIHVLRPLISVGRQRHAAVHVVEVVFVGGGKTRRIALCEARFIEHVARLTTRFPAIVDHRSDGDSSEIMTRMINNARDFEDMIYLRFGPQKST